MHLGDHAFRDQDVLDALGTPTPQAKYLELMDQCPVRHNPDGTVTLLRMADIHMVNKAPETLGNGHSGGGIGAFTRPLIPLDLDGPDHRRWRKILNPIFSPAKISPLEPQVREVANTLIDTFIDQGETDVVASWCQPLPSAIFLAILGVPHDDLPRFEAFVRAQLRPDKSLPTEAIIAQMNAAAEDLYAYFSELYDSRRSSQGDTLLEWLMRIDTGEGQITRDEFLDLMYLLMMAGLDTVAASLGCILSFLARHPDYRQQVLADASLWPSAVEELMRYETPVQYAQRMSGVDLDLPSGETVPANTVMYVSWSAANLDPDTFGNPLEVDLRRRPNPSIAFASGWHRCLGSHLARMELAASLDEFHKRIPNYALAPGPALKYSGVARTPEVLRLRWA
jgi:cytochrome P450